MPRSHHAQPRIPAELPDLPPPTLHPDLMGYLIHAARWLSTDPHPRPKHCDLCGHTILPTDKLFSTPGYHDHFFTACWSCSYGISQFRVGLIQAIDTCPPLAGWPLTMPPAIRTRRYGPEPT